MTTSSARSDSSHTDAWRHGHSESQNGTHGAAYHGRRDGRQDQQAPAAGTVDWTEAYTHGLVVRVAAACRGHKPTPLAAKLDLHPETVRRYLNGQRPSPEFLAAICRELGVSAEWLLLGKGEMHRPGKG
jgi:hypothetical protein